MRREETWVALSHAFLDDEIDCSLIADIPLSRLKQIFFNEVAPYCGPHMLSVTPPTFEGFDNEELIASIRSKLTRGQSSPLDRILQKGRILFYQWFFREVWRSVTTKLTEYKKSLVTGGKPYR
jgi:hypothetical protein